MIAQDPFCQRYAKLLEDTYDVVDRIVLNAYFPLACGPGGFRCWWRQLHGGEAELNNTKLMRFAGRFSRRLRGWAKKKNVPVVYTKPGQRKHLVADDYLPTDPAFTGIFLVIVGRAPAPVWDVQLNESGAVRNIYRKTPMPWVNYYHFHIIDAEWGHLTIKMCGHAPFSAQIMLNGHEFVASLARKNGICFTKEGNCFTNVSGAAGLSDAADALRSQTAVGRLRQVCERWIYNCVCFGLTFDEQRESGFHYRFSVFQVEYSRNLLFTSGKLLDRTFNAVIDRTRSHLDVKTLKTIFGAKKRPHRRRTGPQPRLEVVLEKPSFDLTIFKLHFGKLTLKMYSKGERVLRIEAIAHNTLELKLGRAIHRFHDMVGRLHDMVEQFLGALRCIDVAWLSDDTLDALPAPSVVGRCRVGGVNINQPRMRAAMAAAVALSVAPHGFTTAEHAERVRQMSPLLRDTYTVRHAAYDLKKLRGKQFIKKNSPRARKYRPTQHGLRAMVALAVLRDKVITPLLTFRGQKRRGPIPKSSDPHAPHYHHVYQAMANLFKSLGIAA